MINLLHFFKSLFQKKTSESDNNLKSIINNGAFLVDLRTAGEFELSNIPGSVNIPLSALGRNVRLFDNKKNIVLVCFSGNRSGYAKEVLEKKGVKNVINGGAWEDVKNLLEN